MGFLRKFNLRALLLSGLAIAMPNMCACQQDIHTEWDMQRTLASYSKSHSARRVASLVANASPLSLYGDHSKRTTLGEDYSKQIANAYKRAVEKGIIDEQQSIRNNLTDGERNKVFRHSLVEMVFAYTRRQEISAASRVALISEVGAIVTEEEFKDLRELIMFELLCTVWKQRVQFNRDTALPPTDDENRIIKQLADHGSDEPQVFSSFCRGLMLAAQLRNHGDEKGQDDVREIYEGIQWILKSVPLDDRGRWTPIFQLAFGQSDRPSKDPAQGAPPTPPTPAALNAQSVDLFQGALTQGFYRLLVPRFICANEQAWKHLVVNDAQAILNDALLDEKLADRITELAQHVFIIEARLDKIEERLANLESRVTNLEARFDGLEETVRQMPATLSKLQDLRAHPQKANLPERPEDTMKEAIVLNMAEQQSLLQKLAPVLLPDRINGEDSEPVVSCRWLVEHCGIIDIPDQTRVPITPPQVMPPVGTTLEQLNDKLHNMSITQVDPHHLHIDMQQYSPIDKATGKSVRSGPAGNSHDSMLRAIRDSDGIYGLVQPLGDHLYSVQYYVLLTYNNALISEIDLGPFDKRFHHGGDWLCYDVTVWLPNEAKDVEKPIVLLAYYHNHGPVIEVEPYAIEYDDEAHYHARVYMEWGSNEAQPRAGGQGDRHCYVLGIRRNRRIEDTPSGALNEWIEELAVRPHQGRATDLKYDTSKATIKNLRSDDPECQFIREYRGVWGNDGDSPQSPFWNDTMRGRNFGF